MSQRTNTGKGASPRSVILLAPAGDFGSLHAALRSGADAVYFGVGTLNMRSRAAANFRREDLPRVAELCTEIFGGKNPASGAHPARREFRQLATEKPKVYLIPYDSTQLLIGIRTRGAKFDLANLPVSMLFNQYFGGGGLDSIVFQEIRESRSLAYSAYAYYGSAMEKDKYDVFMGFVATQPDKCFTAIDEMLRLFRKMPLQPARFDNARAKLMKSMTSERSFGDLSGLWFRANKMGIAHDWRKAAFEKLRSLELKDIAAFAEKEVAPRVYEVFIAGDVKSLDREKLKRYGEIVDLAPEQVFGY